MSKNDLHHVVILGGGFGGIQSALALAHVPVRVTLVDRRNFHLFQPLLYQIATGLLSPANVASPLRNLLKGQVNTSVLMAEAVGLDADRRILHLADGELPYDSLIVAAGARHHYFGHPEWEAHAPGLKTIEDAVSMRCRIFGAFEAAERETDAIKRASLMTFVVVGGGPTGVELAGALAEIARHTLAREFRHIDTSQTHIMLVEAAPQILSAFSPEQSRDAVAALTRLGVTVRTATVVADINSEGVLLKNGVVEERLCARTILWSAGVMGSPIGKIVAQATKAPLDRAGRIVVGHECALATHPEIMVIGDIAHVGGIDAPSLPGVAPVAMQQGTYAAQRIQARLAGRSVPPFVYRDRGSMTTIGRGFAIAQVGRWKFSGMLAWLAWVFVHLIALVRFESRLLVLLQWSWHYFTWNSNARLITGREASEKLSSEPCGVRSQIDFQSLPHRP